MRGQQDMRGWRRGLFEVGSPARAARRCKLAVGALGAALTLEAVVLELPFQIVPARPAWLAPVIVGGTITVDLGLVVLVAGTTLEYAAWVRQAFDRP